MITRSLSAISFANKPRGGRRLIYRNLIDLREPTAGNRPRRKRRDRGALRYGHLYKSSDPDGPWELFQNTFVGSAPQPKFKATFAHLRATAGASAHRALNNLFVAAGRPGAPAEPILLVPPPPAPPTVSDGNAYFRVGTDGGPLFRELPGDEFFPGLAELREHTGFERHGSIEGDPGLRRLGADGALRPTDDLRLTEGGPGSTAGVELPLELRPEDPFYVPDSPSVGAFRGDERLRVGVDGEHVFPSAN